MVAKHLTGLYVLSALLAGITGVLMASEFRAGVSSRATGYEFDALVIALLGGSMAAQNAYPGVKPFAGMDLTAATDILMSQLSRDPSGIPQPPQNLVITHEGNNIHLQWDPVTLDTNNFPLEPDAYTIYLSTIPFGSYTYQDVTTETQYTHTGVLNFQSKVFYRVRAVKN